MVDSTTASITIGAEAKAVLDVIADFEAYPQWAGAVKRAEVLGRLPDGRVRVVWAARSRFSSPRSTVVVVNP